MFTLQLHLIMSKWTFKTILWNRYNVPMKFHTIIFRYFNVFVYFIFITTISNTHNDRKKKIIICLFNLISTASKNQKTSSLTRTRGGGGGGGGVCSPP